MFSKWAIVIACLLLLKVTGLEKKVNKDAVTEKIELSGQWKFNKKDNAAFKNKEFDDSNWEDIMLPGTWESQGHSGYDGIAWYRNKFKVPEKWRNQALALSLGKVDDKEETYINGKKIGGTDGWNTYRTYNIPSEAINYGGDNVIAVKVIENNNSGWDTITVNYDGSVIVAITSPADKYDTNVGEITVSGSTSDGANFYIYLNGTLQSQTVLSKSAWSGTSSLSGTGDSISVIAVDALTNTSWDTITVNYDGSAGVEITYPAEDLDTNVSAITVKGISDGTAIYIYRDNILQTQTTVSNGAWTGTASLAGTGENIAVKTVDAYTNIAWDTITVDYDTGVYIEITSPSHDHDTTVREITVKGTSDAVDGSYIYLYVNNSISSQLTVSSFQWSGTAALTGSGDSISVKVTDSNTNEDWDTITVNYDGAIDITITFPDDNIDTRAAEIAIAGSTLNGNDGDSVAIYVNSILNSQFQIANSQFSGTAALTGIGDSISAKLTNQYGYTSQDTITVNYLPPGFIITFPDSVYYTFNDTIIVTGTSVNIIPEDYANIYNNITLFDSLVLSTSWEYTLSLSQGYNYIEIYLNNSVSSEKTAVYKLMEPSVPVITSHRDMAYDSAIPLTVSGTNTAGDSACPRGLHASGRSRRPSVEEPPAFLQRRGRSDAANSHRQRSAQKESETRWQTSEDRPSRGRSGTC